MAKTKQMMETDEKGIKRQFFPVTHAGAVLGLKEFLEGDFFQADFDRVMALLEERSDKAFAEIDKKSDAMEKHADEKINEFDNKIAATNQTLATLEKEIYDTQQTFEKMDVYTKAETDANVIDQVDQLEGKIDTKLANKADKTQVTKVEDMISKMPSATPKETFASLSALQAKYPIGDNSAMVVLETDGKTGYVYLWNGTAWQKGALYQSQGIADNSIIGTHVSDNQIVSTKLAIGGVELPKTFSYSTSLPNSTSVISNRLYSKIITNPEKQYTGVFDAKRFPEIEWCVFKPDGSTLLGWSSNAELPKTLTDFEGEFYWALRKKDNLDFSKEEFSTYSNCIYYISENTVSNPTIFNNQLVKKTNELTAPLEYSMINGVSNNSYYTQTLTQIEIGNYFEKVFRTDEIKNNDRLSVVLNTDYTELPIAFEKPEFVLRERRADYTVINTTYFKHVGSGLFLGEITIKDTDFSNVQIFLDNRSGSEKLLVNMLRVNVNNRFINLEYQSKNTFITKYVSLNGNDNNSGDSHSSAYRTFQKAVQAGATTIRAERGKYYNQSLQVKDKEKFTILPSNKITYQIGVNDDVEKIEFINGDLFKAESKDNLLEFDFTGNQRFRKVFIDKTLLPEIPGDRPSYNCGVWQKHNEEKFDVKLKPVLSLEECHAESGTFFWNGSKIFVNQILNSSALEGFVVQNDIDITIDIQDCGEVILEDVSVAFSYSQNYRLWNIQHLSVRNCDSKYTILLDGFSMNNVNGSLDSCISKFARNDGFNMHNYGDTHFNYCEGHFNGDDGISHHDGCTGSITGGEWSYNGKGGVSSPTYGSIVHLFNNYSHHNRFGLYALEGAAHPKRSFRIFGNVFSENTDYDIQITGDYTALAKGNVFKTMNGGSRYIDLN